MAFSYCSNFFYSSDINLFMEDDSDDIVQFMDIDHMDNRLTDSE